MYALLDCNSFFCSVEKVFHPGFQGKPLCVLSNNDGCIVALTPEAKALGLRRGDPIFKVQDIVQKHQVAVFSSNLQLYAAMSKRVFSIVRKMIPATEVYSIDECFCTLDGYGKFHDMERLMRSVVHRIQLYTDIPVSVGIAPTKTLAKVASRFAKKYADYQGVCMIDNEEKRKKALQHTDLGDIWGIGRQTLGKLVSLQVCSPWDFSEKSAPWVRSHLYKPGIQTWMELNGKPSIETSIPANRSLCTSQSFGTMVNDLPSLRAAVASFASSCANKLRAQHSVAGAVTVFLFTNRFRQDLQQYFGSDMAVMSVLSSDTLEITRTALRILDRIYRPGIWYKKAGVVLTDIHMGNVVQQNLFDTITNRPSRGKLMQVIDDINHRYGIKTVRMSVEGTEKEQPWKSRSLYRSPNYLTDIHEILTVGS